MGNGNDGLELSLKSMFVIRVMVRSNAEDIPGMLRHDLDSAHLGFRAGFALQHGVLVTWLVREKLGCI